MGLNEKGYHRPSFQEILGQKIEKAKELFGQDIDTGELTPLGKFIRINAYDQAKAYEDIEGAYYARFPNTARGVSLDRLCVFAGITRNPAAPAIHTVDIQGEPGQVVPMEFLVRTNWGVHFYNVQDTTIGEDGTCTITVHCVENGKVGNVGNGSINDVVNVVAGIQTVSNSKLIQLGSEEEDDTALRSRFSTAVAGAGSCNVDAIRAAIARVPTVTSVSVIENTADTVDDKGRPPHSFECFVLGGEAYHKEIAQSIFEKKPVGIKSYGQEQIELLDEGGYAHTIYFSHTENIVLKLKITIRGNSRLSDHVQEEIAEQLADYINHLGVGVEVYLSALYGFIHAVEGIEEVVSLQVSTDGGSIYTTNNVACEDWQVVQLSVDDVAVEVMS